MFKRVKVILSIVLTMLFAVSQSALSEAAPDMSDFRQTEEFPFVFVTECEKCDEGLITDSMFNILSRGIQFKLAKTDLNPNDPFLVDYVNEVLPFAKKKGWQLAKVIVRGAASPEGKYSFNQKLGRERTRKLVEFLQNADSTSTDAIESVSITEDYSYLLYLMEQADDPDYAKVKSIYDEFKGNELSIKHKLSANRTLWLRLYRTYFPKLRSARLILLFRDMKAQPQVAPKPLFDTTPVFPIEVQQPTFPVIPIEPVVVEEPVIVEPIVEEPVVEEPTVEEPVIEEPIIEEPIVEEVEPDTVSDDRLSRREFMSVKSNLLFDFAYVPGYDKFCPIPNVAVEFYPKHGHFTYGASFDCPWWQDYWGQKFFQIRNYQVHSRYYFRSGDVDKRGYGNGAAFKGAYVSAYAHAGLYSICFAPKRAWEGEGAGAGLGVGYVLPLGKKEHWRLEFGAQGGYFRSKYDPYQWECPVNPTEQTHLYYYKWTGKPELFKRRQYRYSWLGPTRVEVTLSYDILYRKRDKKGVSFRSTEKAANQIQYSQEGGMR